MKRIALVTNSEFPRLTDSDSLLINPLLKFGFETYSCIWDDQKVEWANFDAVIIRSSWGYHERLPEFNVWLDKLENLKVRLFNDYPVIRWNSNKKYLLELEKEGVKIIPTKFFIKSSQVSFRNIVSAFKADEIIIKPSVGAEAYKVKKFSKSQVIEAQRFIDEILIDHDILVQPFINDIQTEGEISMIFFNKVYSHAVLKKPKKGEFRSNYAYGGKESRINPDINIIIQAQNILNKINFKLLYARVDGINIAGVFYLMELELIEPYLFFEMDKDSPVRFVNEFLSIRSI